MTQDGFELIDQALGKLCKEFGLTIFTDFGGHATRFFYFSASTASALQFSIEVRSSGQFAVFVEPVEGDIDYKRELLFQTDQAYDTLSSLIKESLLVLKARG